MPVPLHRVAGGARVEPDFGRGHRSYLAHSVDANDKLRMVWRLNCMSCASIIRRSLLNGNDLRVFCRVAVDHADGLPCARFVLDTLVIRLLYA